MDYTSVKVGQLPTDEISGGNFIPHEVAGVLKKATFTDLAAFIGASDAVGFKAVSVSNGDTLPATETQEFILVGPGTYNNVGGGSPITVTEELNALVSNGTYWFVGVEIPIDAPPGNAVWGQIIGTLSNQTDLQNLFNLKADLVDGKVPSSQLPSYVDDVIEVANYAALPATGDTGKIYITIDTEYIYRWSGSAYIRIVDEAAAWGTITGTLSNQTDLQAALDAKEDDIAAGTTAQYWRGDKSWQTLNKAAVGLSNVDNTSDLNKPISTATQTALDGKFDDPTGDTTQYIAGDGSLISFPIAGQAGTLVRSVLNNSGATITKGTVVYINGASGNKPTIAKALATGDSTSAQTFGLVQSDISNNANGYVVCVGDLIGVNTSGISVGTQLYLSSSVAGEYTTTKQVAPAHLVYIGVITRSHPTQGQIEVKIQNGYELDEIHDVLITSKANNDLLTYESSSSLWKNKSIFTILGYTPSNDSNVVHITGSETITGLKKFTDFLSTDKAYNQKIISGGFLPDAGYANIYQNDRQITFLQYNAAATAVTQFSFIYPDSNTTQFYYVPNASGTLALTSQLHNAVTIGTANGLSLSTQVLSLGLASGSANGALSSTDWTTFNNKQNAITNLIDGIVTTGYIPKSTSATSGLTTLGNSLIYDNGTNIGIGTAAPNYSSTNRRVLDINGATQSMLALSVGGVGKSFLFYTGTDLLVSNESNGAIKLNTNGSQKVVIEAGGNVGIGTTSPNSKIQILGVSGDPTLTAGTAAIATFTPNGVGTELVMGSSASSPFTFWMQNRHTGINGLAYPIALNPLGGNVGIGVTSPSRRVETTGGSGGGFAVVGNSGATDVSSTGLGFNTGYSSSYITSKTSAGANADLYIEGNNVAFNGGGVERMRITSVGSVLVGTTTNTYVSRLVLDGAVDNNTLECKHTGTGSVYNVIFVNGNGYVGDIRTNGSSTSFNTTSDYRLKQDLQPINGLDLVSQIKVYNYQWKVDESRSYGVLAHELQEVVPQAVNGEKDAEQMQSVDYSKLVPILVQAIKELKAEIEILKTK